MQNLGGAFSVPCENISISLFFSFWGRRKEGSAALPVGRKLDCVTWGQKVAKEGLILHFGH